MCLGINYSKLINKFSITFQQLTPQVHFRHLERNLNKNHSQTNVSESLTSSLVHCPVGICYRGKELQGRNRVSG